MTSVTPFPPAPQREPRLAVTARAETVKRGRLLPVYADGTWTKRPAPRPTGWHGAELVIGGTVYAAESFHTGDDFGNHWQIVDLFKPDGTHYRLTFGPDGEQCDCPHATYRGCRCKHVATVRAALDWLEERERLEWEAAVAVAALDGDQAAAPF